jgi:hypothetical protein
MDDAGFAPFFQGENTPLLKKSAFSVGGREEGETLLGSSAVSSFAALSTTTHICTKLYSTYNYYLQSCS